VSLPPVQVVVSIDTEEDNWSATRDGVTVENVRALPAMQRHLRSLGLRPTYFADHAVVREPWAADVLRALRDDGAELGAHLHPWNTPPLEEAFVPRHTMLRNLPPALQRAKLATLCDAFERRLGERPRSFRAGRFGLGAATVAALVAEGFRVDSSVTPWIDWSGVDEGSRFEGAPLSCYRLDGRGDPAVPVAGGPLVEVPVSCGFTRRPFPWRARAFRALRSEPLGRLRLAGPASRLGIVRRVTGSPESESPDDLVALSRRLVEDGVGLIQLFWHSPSHVPGLSPFVRDASDRARLDRTLALWLEGLARFASPVPATVSEAAACLCPDPTAAA